MLKYFFNGNTMEKKYMLGNEAIAYGLFEGGIDASFAYPGTPSSEITEKLVDLSKKEDIYVEWSINEKVSYENAYGVSLTGRRSCVIMKHVDLNVASDPFITSVYTGIIGGLVIIVADDPFAYSSQNEQDSRRYWQLAKTVCFEPSSIQESKNIAKFSFEFSEKIGLPVMIRSVTKLSHGKSDVLIGKRQKKISDYGFKKNPSKFVMVPSNARIALKKLNEKQNVIKREIEKLPFNRFEKKENRIGIVACGLTYNYVKEFTETEKKNFSIFKVSTYPLPEKKLKNFMESVKEIVVFEEGDPVVEELIYIYSKMYNLKNKIYGKINNFYDREGELSVDKVEGTFYKIRGKKKKYYSFSIPERPPVLCAGCPHLGSFYILKKVFGKDALFPGDIGCYTLGVKLETIDTCLCMGAGISMGSGMSRFEKKDVVSIIGDSTFFHTGIPALINAVYNKANQFICILDNRTTAMTGHQPHPGTGINAKKEKTVEIELKKLISNCGVEDVIEVDPYKIKEAIEKIKGIKDKKGVKVIIFKRECIITSKGKKIQYYIDTKRCKGCKLCLTINCPAISFKNGKAEIGILCNGCGMCENICPYKAIVKDEKES
mgnify:FL=1